MKIEITIQSYHHINGKEFFFNDLNFNIDSNGIYFLIGSSGIGKTTLLNIILGLNQGNFKGCIKFNKDNVEYSPIDLRKKGLVGYMSQDSILIPWLNVCENLLLPSKINKNLSVPSANSIDEILTALNFDLSNVDMDILCKYGNELSFGMRVRIGLARVLLYNPSFLILDELFTGTDSYTNDCISKYLVNKKKDMIIFSVSHNVEKAFDIAERILVLNKQNGIRCLTFFDKSEFKAQVTNIINLLKN